MGSGASNSRRKLLRNDPRLVLEQTAAGLAPQGHLATFKKPQAIEF